MNDQLEKPQNIRLPCTENHEGYQIDNHHTSCHTSVTTFKFFIIIIMLMMVNIIIITLSKCHTSLAMILIRDTIYSTYNFIRYRE